MLVNFAVAASTVRPVTSSELRQRGAVADDEHEGLTRLQLCSGGGSVLITLPSGWSSLRSVFTTTIQPLSAI